MIMNNKSINIAIAFCIAGLGIASSASAAPPAKSTWQIRGNGAYASAFTGNDCQWASFDITGNDDVMRSGGSTASNAGVWVGYWSYDWCKGSESYGDAYVEGNFSGNQSTASANVSFTIYTYGWVETPYGWDYVFLGSRTARANVSWTGVGTAQRGMESWTSRWGQTMGRYRWMGSYRQAEVNVSLSIAGGTQSLEYAYGSIGQYSSGAVEISRY
jgi:hypothetical protein